MRTNRSLFITVVIVLILNLIMLSKIGDLTNQIRNLSHDYNNIQSRLDSISGNVNNTLAQFTREQNWITPVQVNNEKTEVETEEGEAVLNWQIKDYQEGAEVIFHYRESESDEFKAIPAVHKGNGFFEANMPLKVKVEPFWEINVTKIIDSGKNSRATVTNEVAATPYGHSQAIGYYVSMKMKDIIKSSEISYFDLAYLTNIKYEPIRGHIDISNNKYHFSLYEHYPANNNYESLKAIFYDGSNVIAEKDVEVRQNDNNTKVYYLLYDAGSHNISHIVLQVKYTNGSTYEKEIY